MKHADSLSRRRRLRFWGWGYEDEALLPEEAEAIRKSAARRFGRSPREIAPPRAAEIELRAPRIAPPAALAGFLSASAYDRLTHSYGKSYPDLLRMFLREVPHPPDWVAFPRSEEEIARLLDWAQAAGVAVIPFGGGSSVAGGVEPDVGADYAGAVSLDLQYLCRVLEIDSSSRAALIEAGALGPEIEEALRPHGLTLRHFPQSFQLSTLGGWIATRSGGHYASVYTHIDDFVESVRALSPGGVMESRRLPGSGAGPSPDRMLIGSEGTLGVITRAWMRLQARPRFRAGAGVAFAGMEAGAGAVRALSQSGLFPANCRLLDPAEVAANRLSAGGAALLVLGFESADHDPSAKLARALEIAADHGGRAGKNGAGPGGAAGAWRTAFLRMPYYRNLATGLGLINDTFESAVTWDKFDAFYAGVREKMGAVLEEVCGAPVEISCRFTHIYPDGPAPYFSFTAPGGADGDLRAALARWREIKQAANEVMVGLGGTITHHHAVGRDHRSGYDAQAPALFRRALAAAKSALDPQGILNPGALIDPQGKTLSPAGVMKEPPGG